MKSTSLTAAALAVTVQAILAQEPRVKSPYAQSVRELAGKEVRIRSAVAGKYLTVESAVGEQAGKIVVRDFEASARQSWLLIPAGDWFLVQSKLGRFLDVPWANPAPGTTAHMWDFNGGVSQRWRLARAPDGTIHLQSALGTYLDVQGKRAQFDEPAWLGAFNGGTAQKWTIEMARAGDAGTVGSSRTGLSAVLGTRWQAMPITVCWENAAPSNDQFRTDVRAAVEQSWERESAVRFFGWGACGQHAGGIRISIADEGPHVKAVGRLLDGMPAGMVLNDRFRNWSPVCAGPAMRANCVTSIAIHEFGHALGFTHEHNRRDCSFASGTGPGQICTDAPQGTTGDYNVTDCDADSILNYCFNAGYRGQLSARDIQGVRAVYGTGRYGARETITFRPAPLGVLCPNRLLRGDRDFNGAPRILTTARLRISPDQRDLVAEISFFATESQPVDPTQVSSHWERVIWSAEPGKRIVGIRGDTRSEVNFTGRPGGFEIFGCNDGVVETPPVDGGSFVRQFHIIADTGAEDVSHDDNCGCDTQIRGIDFNAVTVEVEPIR